MPNETKIEPALTAEEWKARRKFRPRKMKPDPGDDYWGLEVEVHRVTGLTVGQDADESSSSHREPDDIFAIIALANAALPDDDPRKITRADVKVLRDLARTIIDDDERPYVYGSEVCDTLAAKLAALLPPE